MSECSGPAQCDVFFGVTILFELEWLIILRIVLHHRRTRVRWRGDITRDETSLGVNFVVKGMTFTCDELFSGNCIRYCM